MSEEIGTTGYGLLSNNPDERARAKEYYAIGYAIGYAIPKPEGYHFRYDIWKTPNFKLLDDWRNVVIELKKKDK